MAEPDNDFEHDPDVLAFDLSMAMGPNPPRSAVNAVWTAIANGNACNDTKIRWVEHLAKYVHQELLEGYDPDDRQRGSKALRVLGLYGKVDGKYTDDRNFVADLFLFAEAEGSGIKITPAFVMQCRYPDFQGTEKERKSLHKRLGEVITEARVDANIAIATLAKIKNDPAIMELMDVPPRDGRKKRAT